MYAEADKGYKMEKRKNETIELLMKRKSMRVFEDKPVPQDVKRQLLENSIRKHSLAKRDILANEYTKELKKLDDVVEQKYGNINLREVDLLPDM